MNDEERIAAMTPEQRAEIAAMYGEYEALCHAMQSGVTMMQNYKPETGRDARVGINTAMSDHGALIGLLIEKGVFTELEYATKLRDYMQREVDRYVREIAQATGADPERISLA